MQNEILIRIFTNISKILSNIFVVWHLVLIAIFAFLYTHRNIMKNLAEKRIENLRECFSRIIGLLRRRQSALEKYFDRNGNLKLMVEKLNDNNRNPNQKDEHDSVDEKTRQAILNGIDEVVRDSDYQIEYYRAKIEFSFNPKKDCEMLRKIFGHLDSTLKQSPSYNESNEVYSQKMESYKAEVGKLKEIVKEHLQKEWDNIQSLGHSIWIKFLFASILFLVILAVSKG